MTSLPIAKNRLATLVFDCDGVLLDSNRIKTEAFRRVALRFGSDAADAFVCYHVQNGGISRYQKIRYLLASILTIPIEEEMVNELVRVYAAHVRQGLLTCTVADGLAKLRANTSNLRWMVVSGGDETELRHVFSARGLDHLFDCGIYGSPANKDEILSREIASGNLKLPALFIGDSRYDHEAAIRAGLQFAFVSAWTEFNGWQGYCQFHRIPVIDRISDLEFVEH